MEQSPFHPRVPSPLSHPSLCTMGKSRGWGRHRRGRAETDPVRDWHRVGLAQSGIGTDRKGEGG
eukprot:scaffold208_cov323-Pavlova_lutheri.AAC.2